MKNNSRIGENFVIHSYKHDGSIHRAWDEAILLDETDDYLVFGNEKTKVTESNGRTWKTKEPAILYFYKNQWFNVIGQCKKDGIYYYCNIASPFVIEDKTIKYIVNIFTFIFDEVLLFKGFFKRVDVLGVI